MTYNKFGTASLCKYSAITVTHLNVKTSINMQTLKFMFLKNKENNSDLHKIYTDSSHDSLQQVKPNIPHLDVLSMIHDLLHFFPGRNQSGFTLLVVKFYNRLRNVHYRERLNLVSACVPQLIFLYLCCLFWFDSSVLNSVEVTVQCRCLQIPLSCSIQKHQQNFHLETELDAKHLQICMNVCAFHSTVTNVCLEM